MLYIAIGARILHLITEQLQLVMSHPKTVIDGAAAAAKCSKWLRPFLVPFMKEMKHIKRTKKRMQTIIAHELMERSSRRATETGYELPSDLISWTVKETDGKAWDPLIQVEYQTALGWSLPLSRVRGRSWANLPLSDSIHWHNVRSDLYI